MRKKAKYPNTSRRSSRKYNRIRFLLSFFLKKKEEFQPVIGFRAFFFFFFFGWLFEYGVNEEK